MTHLALDGPSNGMYIDADQAEEEGYDIYDWPSGEQVWIHGDGAHTLEDEFDPDPVRTLIFEAVNGAEVR